MDPEKRWDVFLSYARDDDAAFVSDLHRLLAGPGRGLSVWFDQETMPSRGRGFVEEIARAISGSDRLLLVLGEHALGSEYVRAEWQYALAQDVAVVPLLRFKVAPPVGTNAYAQVPAELRSLHLENISSASAAECVDRIVDKLREPLPTPGPVSADVPRLPPHFQPRPDAIADLSRRIIQTRPQHLGDPTRFVVLHGMSGTGKSVIAAAFARSRNTRLAFGDGVVWVSASRLGSDHEAAAAELRDSIERELKHLPARLTVADLANPAVRLLVIVDDAGAAGPLSFLWNALGVECRVVVTTQHAELAAAFGADGQAVEPLRIDDALMLVARFSRTTPEALPADARDVVARLGGVAFALSVAGALVAAGDSWADLREKLEYRDLPALAHTFPNYPHPSVFAMLDYAVGRLTPDDQLLFRALHVFSATQPVPESIVVAFWRRMGGGRPDELRSLITRLTQCSLLTTEGESPQRLLRIHDLLAVYCRATGTNERSAAAFLLEAYQTNSEMHLPGTPEHRYWLRGLIRHMDQADAVEAAFELFGRFEGAANDWYMNKIAAGDFSGYLADVRIAWTMQERHVATAADVARLIWYALVATSTRAAGGSLPDGLWGVVASSRAVPIRTLLSQAMLLEEPAARGRVLLELLPSIPDADRPPWIAAIRQAADESAPDDCVGLLSQLVQHVDDAQLPALRSAVAAAAAHLQGASRAVALSHMAAQPRLGSSAGYVEEAYTLATGEPANPLAQGALIILMPLLSPERRRQAIDRVAGTAPPRYPGWDRSEKAERRHRLSQMLPWADPDQKTLLTDAALKDGAEPHEPGALEPFARFLAEDFIARRWESVRNKFQGAQDFGKDQCVSSLVETVRLMSRRGPVPMLVDEARSAARGMESLEGLFGRYGKAMALARLVTLYPEPDRRSLWDEALSTALALEDRNKQVSILRVLADDAPPDRRADVLQMAWTRAQRVADAGEVLTAVGAAVRYADGTGVDEALAFVREQRKTYEYSGALMAVAQRIVRRGDVARGMALVEELDPSQPERIGVLGQLVPLLPDDKFDSVWRGFDLHFCLRSPLGSRAVAGFVKRRPSLVHEVVLRITGERGDHWDDFVRALAGVGLLVEALKVARTVGTGDDGKLLIASSAADDAEPDQVRQFLLGIPDRDARYRAQVIARLGPKLVDVSVFERALESVDLHRVGDDWKAVGIDLLQGCGDSRVESLFHIALDAVLSWKEPADRIKGLSGLARCLPRSAKDRFGEVLKTENQQHDWRIVIPLTGRLAQLGSIEDALRFARGLTSSGDRARALCMVVPHARQLGMRITREALEAASADPDWSPRWKGLRAATALVLEAPREESLALFELVLHRLARRVRPELLRDLNPLMPWVNELGGSDAILGVIRALRDVTARWR